MGNPNTSCGFYFRVIDQYQLHATRDVNADGQPDRIYKVTPRYEDITTAALQVSEQCRLTGGDNMNQSDCFVREFPPLCGPKTPDTFVSTPPANTYSHCDVRHISTYDTKIHNDRCIPFGEWVREENHSPRFSVSLRVPSTTNTYTLGIITDPRLSIPLNGQALRVGQSVKYRDNIYVVEAIRPSVNLASKTATYEVGLRARAVPPTPEQEIGRQQWLQNPEDYLEPTRELPPPVAVSADEAKAPGHRPYWVALKNVSLAPKGK